MRHIWSKQLAVSITDKPEGVTHGQLKPTFNVPRYGKMVSSVWLAETLQEGLLQTLSKISSTHI